MKSRPGKRPETLPIRRVPVHELFPQPGTPGMQGQQSRAPKRGMRTSAKEKVKTKTSGPRIPSLPTQNLVWAVVFLGLVISGFGLLGFLRKPSTEAPFVLLDLRAVETGGHPVTAATVTVNNVAMGVTDSFGEWRRYLRFQPGETIAVSFEKNAENPLVGSRQLVVPAPRKGQKQDIELTASIEMKSARDHARKNKAVAQKVEKKKVVPEPKVVEEVAVAEEPKAEVEEKNDDLMGIEDSVSDTNDKSLGIYFEDGLSRIAVSAVPFSGSKDLMEKRQANVIQERILPVLVNELQGAGVGVDRSAPWKLSLSYVANQDQPGYIKADISWQNPFGQAEKSSFIAGYAKTYEETSRAIAALLRLHMKKTYWAFKEDGHWFIDESSPNSEFWKMKGNALLTDTSGEKFPVQLVAQTDTMKRWKLRVGNTQPCEAVRQRSRCMVSTESAKDTAPIKGWVLQKMRFNGAVPKGVDVYVAGFQAYPTGNGSFEYWGPKGSALKALVISGSRIVHAQTINETPGAVAQVRFPSAKARL